MRAEQYSSINEGASRLLGEGDASSCVHQGLGCMGFPSVLHARSIDHDIDIDIVTMLVYISAQVANLRLDMEF